jgi:hypothetical protein
MGHLVVLDQEHGEDEHDPPVWLSMKLVDMYLFQLGYELAGGRQIGYR